MRKFLFFFLLTQLSQVTYAGAPDTAHAQVERPKNDCELIPRISCKWLTPKLIDSKIDALTATFNFRKAGILFWIKTKSQKNLRQKIIDSLYNCNPIPYTLINYYTTYLNNAGVNTQKHLLSRAHSFFYNWNEHHPFHYPLNYQYQDSLKILEDSVNFTFPVPHKPLYPFHASITSEYGFRNGRQHKGLDIDLHTGDPVVSVFKGVVRMARRYGGYGNVVIVRHFNGTETLYAHLSAFSALPGDTVYAGQKIAAGGNTGHSTGSHLHFEIRYDGLPIDPEQIINTESKQLKAAHFVLEKYKNQYIALIHGQKYHKVKHGDYWYKIARKYGMDIKKLYRLNGISKPYSLRSGQMIRIDR